MESRTPQHVAIIMDGNGRWAQRRGHARIFGHVRGAQRIKSVVMEAERSGVKALTLYAFSTENWNRPDSELRVLWSLLKKFLKRETENLHRNNVRLQILGEFDRLDPAVQKVVAESVARLSENTGLKLSFAVSYGARAELLRAARNFARDCQEGRSAPDELTAALFEKYLWTSELGDQCDVDLVIRTSGEKRISNFLLWQAAYAEFVFMDVCWPEFGPEHFGQALREYASRERRFGGLLPEASRSTLSFTGSANLSRGLTRKEGSSGDGKQFTEVNGVRAVELAYSAADSWGP